MLRILLFLCTNMAVMLIFGLILSLTSISANSFYGLIIISGLFGFGGSIISLFMSKWIALYSVNGKLITTPINNTEIWLVSIIRQYSNKIGIKTPEIAIYPSHNINAFATGVGKHSSLIAVSHGLLDQMTSNEIEAIIAHEISHISNGDMITMTLVQGIMNTMVMFTSRAIAKIISSDHTNNKNDNGFNENSLTYYIVSIVLDLLFGTLANLIILWFSRYREFHADAGAAILSGKHNMIQALKKLKNNCEPEEPNYIRTFCIYGKSNSIWNLFNTHPSLDERITALHNNTYIST
ncbi:MAG: protease HtpX [Buchnera aphidicola (Eriosoma harunire)]